MPLETILLALEEEPDEIEPIAETAADIAGPAGANVALAHVFESEEYETVESNLDFDDDSDVTPDDIARRYTTISTLAETLSERGIDVSTHGRRSGDLNKSEAIVKLAAELEAGMVIIGGRKRSPTGKAVFGSTVQDVLLNAPCPVMFVRSQ